MSPHPIAMLDLSKLARMANFDAFAAAIANAEYRGRMLFPNFISWPGFFRQ